VLNRVQDVDQRKFDEENSNLKALDKTALKKL
jgi:hypothetical protein